MKTIHISKDNATTVKARGDDTLYVVDKGVSLTANVPMGSVIDAGNGASNRDLLINGHVSGDVSVTYGITIGDMTDHSGGGELTIGKHGSVSGMVAIVSFGDNEHIVNKGSLSGAVGLGVSGQDVHVENAGTIAGAEFGISGYLSSGLFENSGTIGGSAAGVHLASTFAETNKLINTGTIDGGMIGLSIDGGAGTRNVIINHGTITGGTSSIATSQNPTRDVVRNDGILTGSVHLGAGNDVYDGRGGRATEVSGETGDDTYFVYNKQTVIVEATGEGNDTVKALTNWTLDNGFENLKLLGKSGLTATGNAESNVMKGNSGANILYGLDSDDVLNGGRGDDMLYGGADYDTFVFAKGSGHDHIGDYNGMQDTIDLRGIDGLKTFDDVLEHARETAQGVSLSFGRGDVLTIDGAQLVDLAQDHFMF